MAYYHRHSGDARAGCEPPGQVRPHGAAALNMTKLLKPTKIFPARLIVLSGGFLGVCYKTEVFVSSYRDIVTLSVMNEVHPGERVLALAKAQGIIRARDITAAGRSVACAVVTKRRGSESGRSLSGSVFPTSIRVFSPSCSVPLPSDNYHYQM